MRLTKAEKKKILLEWRNMTQLEKKKKLLKRRIRWHFAKRGIPLDVVEANFWVEGLAVDDGIYFATVGLDWDFEISVLRYALWREFPPCNVRKVWGSYPSRIGKS